MSEQAGCVVVGAGLAAANVVQGLREGGYDRPITLVGDEAERPYERPPLSKAYLQGNEELGALFVHDEGWYAEHEVDTAARHHGHRGSTAPASGCSSTSLKRLPMTGWCWRRAPTRAPSTSPASACPACTRCAGSATAPPCGPPSPRARGRCRRRRWIGLEVAAAARIAGAQSRSWSLPVCRCSGS